MSPLNPKSSPGDKPASSSKQSLRRVLLYSLHNLITISILCSRSYVTAESLSAQSFVELHQNKETSTLALDFESKCNNPCIYIEGYSLQPLPQTNCRQYVLCQKYQETYRYTCPDGQNFNNAMKKCVDGQVECECKLDAQDSKAAAVVEDAAAAEADLDTNAEAEAVCSMHRGNVPRQYPINHCKEYVSCRRNGRVKSVSTCQEGFLFDETLSVCNWQDRVQCPQQGSLVGGDTDASSSFDALTLVNPNNNIEAHDAERDETAERYNYFCAQVAGSNWSVIPIPGCKSFITCKAGTVQQIQDCAEGLIYDVNIMGCNHAYLTQCSVTDRPTMSPTARPTASPTVPPPTRQPVSSSPTTRSPALSEVAPGGVGGVGGVNRTGKPTMRRTFPPVSDSPTSSDAFPRVMEWIEEREDALNEKVFRSYSRDGLSYRSYWFQFDDFMKALKLMSEKSITGNKKHIFYMGDSPAEWEYGVVNAAAFLAQAMTESISKDTCDEYNWEANSDDFSDDKGNPKEGVQPDEHYAISNACGQGGLNYQEFRCDPEESHMECEVDRNMKIQATTSEVYANAPPPLTCRPRTMTDSFTGFWDVMTGKESAAFPYENNFGRTDVEGCCFWGRGAIHTKGVCNLGKLNYYLGAQAQKDGRQSRYPTVDFCGFPEAICAGTKSREMRWVTSMFEWTERVQTYDDGKGWNYMKELKKFVDTGLYNLEFVNATSGIVTQGCHDPPCSGAKSSINGGLGALEVRLKEERSNNFLQALLALGAGGEKALVRALTNFVSERKEKVNSEILQSQTPEGQLYPSYRYQLSDFLSALTKISRDGVAGKKFYVGEPTVARGVRYGIVNMVMFLAQSYKEAIQYDACDENNWSMVNGRFPLSNSCGQLDMSYQDMHCQEEEAHMECPVKPEMEQYALTSALWFQAPGPFKCGPKSKFPTTGYWDYDAGKENNEDAYANERGRVDVEGCCWWGRGIIQTRGVCSYGKLNYYLGARAAREGRKALYPDIDFCEFPQGVCSSDATYGEELQWMVGLFEWVDRIQSYDKNGWNYMEELKAFVDSGYDDFEFVDRVSSILNLGCHSPPCTGISPSATEAHNQVDRNDVFQRFLNIFRVVYNFPAPPPPTPLPTPYPTEEPSMVVPTTNSPTEPQLPTVSPTISPAPTSLAGKPPKVVSTNFIGKVEESEGRLQEYLLLSKYPYGTYPSYLYTWKSFLVALEKMTVDEIGPGPGNWFYIGEEDTANYGLVNLAAFLAYGVTQSIQYDSCDENNWEVVDFRYPLSNSCGQGIKQGGLLYQDMVCTDEDEGFECEVDEKMEIFGVTHASWIGAPQPLYCG